MDPELKAAIEQAAVQKSYARKHENRDRKSRREVLRMKSEIADVIAKLTEVLSRD